MSGHDVVVLRKLGVDFTSSLCGSGFRVSGFWFFVVRLALGVCQPAAAPHRAETSSARQERLGTTGYDLVEMGNSAIYYADLLAVPHLVTSSTKSEKRAAMVAKSS